MIVYISGPMTGLPDYNRQAFADMARDITNKGHSAINPHDLRHDHGKTWSEFMRIDIRALTFADAIVFLPGASKSKGAQIEAVAAKAMGIPFKKLEEL